MWQAFLVRWHGFLLLACHCHHAQIHDAVLVIWFEIHSLNIIHLLQIRRAKKTMVQWPVLDKLATTSMLLAASLPYPERSETAAHKTFTRISVASCKVEKHLVFSGPKLPATFRRHASTQIQFCNALHTNSLGDERSRSLSGELNLQKQVDVIYCSCHFRFGSIRGRWGHTSGVAQCLRLGHASHRLHEPECVYRQGLMKTKATQELRTHLCAVS